MGPRDVLVRAGLVMGPREAEAQRRLDGMTAADRAKLSREQGEALSDAVWAARAQDRADREASR